MRLKIWRSRVRMLYKIIEKIRIWLGFVPKESSLEHIMTYQKSNLRMLLNSHAFLTAANKTFIKEEESDQASN